MIYDCFMFSNELKILELRFAELNSVIDWFVVVEGTNTFTGHAKPLCFDQNKSRFERYLHKVRHVVVNDLPESRQSAWDVEAYQRNAILRGLEGARADDLIVISDVDEIPRSEVIASFTGRLAAAELDDFYYKLNCKDLASKVVASLLVRRNRLTTPQEARQHARHYWEHNTPVIPNGGWHFSCMSDALGLKNKLSSFSHEECNTPEFTDIEAIAHKIKYGLDLVDRRDRYWCCVPLDATFPAYLLAHQEQFSDLLFDFNEFHKNRQDLIHNMQEDLYRTKELIRRFRENECKLEQQKSELRNQLDLIVNSRSWRATRPFRNLAQRARSLLSPRLI
jgi:beta-1,4-mannosyl-glycoprotein beta-1,4-N-acetylglucosaminyltransferase